MRESRQHSVYQCYENGDRATATGRVLISFLPRSRKAKVKFGYRSRPVLPSLPSFPPQCCFLLPSPSLAPRPPAMLMPLCCTCAQRRRRHPLPPRGKPSGLRKRESDDDARGTAAEDQNERATGGASRRASRRASERARELVCECECACARARRDPRRARPLAEAAETRASIGQGGARDRGRQRDKTATIYSCGAVRSYPEVFPLGAE